MKEQINNKIIEILKYIIDKPVEEITYYDYLILDDKLKDMNYEESRLSND